MKRIVDRVKRILRGEEPDHVDCGVCGREACNMKPCRCPPERKGIAVTDLRDTYVHVGSCLQAYAANPDVIGDRKFTDTRIGDGYDRSRAN